jgi:hypothetical protein
MQCPKPMASRMDFSEHNLKAVRRLKLSRGSCASQFLSR